MARHLKRKKKRRSRAWLVISLLCLAAFFLGYWISVNGVPF